jgi:hypothetical protein
VPLPQLAGVGSLSNLNPAAPLATAASMAGPRSHG